MTKYTESDDYVASSAGTTTPSRWIRFGLIAVASAVLGGMATAWWYRNTLIRLRQSDEILPNPQIGISDDKSADEI